MTYYEDYAAFKQVFQITSEYVRPNNSQKLKAELQYLDLITR